MERDPIITLSDDKTHLVVRKCEYLYRHGSRNEQEYKDWYGDDGDISMKIPGGSKDVERLEIILNEIHNNLKWQG